MSKEALAKVVQRSISDAAFRRQLATDPTGALRGYDISADEKSALRSGDSARLSAFGVDQRMSKAFTLGDPSTVGASVNSAHSSDLNAGTASGALTASDAATAAGGSISNSETISSGGAGSSVIPSDPMRPDYAVTGANEPRDTGPAWIGQYNPSAGLGAVQSPDAGDRNLAAATGGVQSPDAADRNLAAFSGGTAAEPRDVAPTWIGEYSGTATGGVQSPDAADRNLADFTGGTAAEPRDVAPTWIGDNQSLSSVMSSDTDGHFTGSPAFDAGSQDEGFLPSVGHMADATLADDTTGGATSDTDATEGPNIHP